MSSAVVALDAGNYADALRLARGAAVLLAVIPDSEFQGERIEFRRDTMTAAIAELTKEAQAGALRKNGGIVSQDITYRRG
jgi:hypothetical protein